jgi:predicted RNA binding protein YcfA (HicA-like mRNA interferase family)
VPDPEKTKAALLEPERDYGHRFIDVVRLLQATGWILRQKGSHHIFKRTGVPILPNLQPEKDGKAKAHQIRQLRRALLQFNIKAEPES